jgi:alkylation response protein AidB-like acyl-CoA dehydrogenase
MNFHFTDEQQLLADTVQRFVRNDYTFEKRRDILRSTNGWSRDVWNQLAAFGLTALNVPEEHGGLNAGPVDTLLVMNALGEGLLLEPYLGAAVVAPILISQLGDTNVSSELLPAIATGERIVIVAHQEPQTRGGFDQLITRAVNSGDSFIIDGQKNVIAHGGAADELLITARTSGNPAESSGMSVFRVAPDTAGVTVNRYRTIDGQTAADIELKRVKLPLSALVGSEGNAFPAIERAHEAALSAICGEAVGIMKAINATTLDYSRNRKQFGLPIGKFQVLQHRMADMFIQSEQALSMSYLAAIRSLEADATQRRRSLSAAKVIIGQAGRFIGQQAIQIHGGMGMTDELMVSHYFKRLIAIDLTYGDTDFHTQRFIDVSRAA